MSDLLYAANLTWRPPGASRPVINDISLTVQPGEFVGLVGPNGAGKSTLLRLLIGYLAPTSGAIALGGTAITALTGRERARRVAYMSQHGPDHFPFTAVEVVEMGAYARRDDTPPHHGSWRDAAVEALTFVGMGDLARRAFPTLSGGEQQLVLFARVLVQDSPLILLDEPTASLDIGHETRLLGMVRELCEEGYAVVAALHHLNSAAEYCTRLEMIASGTIAASGSPEAVLTASALEAHYHVPVHIGRSESTGSVTVHPVPPAGRRTATRVHLIGGAGSAVTLTRSVRRLGCTVTGGVAHERDTDARLWRALAAPHVTVPAFSEIDSAAFSEAADLVDAADITVLCDFPFGLGNSANLDLAERAAKRGTLRIVASTGHRSSRAFFVPGVEERFAALARRVPPEPWEAVLAAVEANGAREHPSATGRFSATERVHPSATGRFSATEGERPSATEHFSATERPAPPERAPEAPHE